MATYTHPIYPELFKGTVTEFIDKPYMVGNERAWQACYICGISISFAKDSGRWLGVGGLIRHKDCDPPPLGGNRAL